MLVAILLTTFVTTSFWYGLYVYFKNKYDLEGEFTTRIVAALHAIVVVILAYVALCHGPNPLYEPGEPNTQLQALCMVVSLGYFIYDFIWCVKYQPQFKVMLAHHFCSILAISFILVYGKSGAEAVGGIGSMELTNPLLQARWFLRTLNKRHTILYQIVEYSFFGLFLSVRLGYGSYLLSSVVSSDKPHFFVKLITSSLFVISILFIYAIAVFISKMIKNTAQSRDDDVQQLC